MLLTAILAALHVVSAILWLGGGMLFGFVIAPRVSRLSPQASGEFFSNVGPAVVWYFRVVGPATVLFGLLLLSTMTQEGLGQLALSNSWGFSLMAGMSFALVALIVSEGAAVPALASLIRLVRAAQGPEGATAAQALPKAGRQAALAANVTIAFLLATFACMVGAGFY